MKVGKYYLPILFINSTTFSEELADSQVQYFSRNRIND
ncbi:MAG: Hypothetical protein AJITA_00409 [Acetilactobacillus jinshanensis]